MAHDAKTISKPNTDAGFFRLFPNYAGTVHNLYGEYPVSFVELHRPTGKYVSRWVLRELNLIMRKHAIVMIGNTCAPGYFFPQLESDRSAAQFIEKRPFGCSVFIANITGKEQAHANAITLAAEPFMNLQLPAEWNEFNDYVKSLSSKYRVRMRKSLESSAELQNQTFTFEKMKNHTMKQCVELLTNTLREKTLFINKDLNGIIKRFGEHFGHQFHFNILFRDEKPVGFVSYTIQGNILQAWHLGYHPDYLKSHQLYQRLMYDLVKTGIEKQVTTIKLGRTATEIKSTIGAKPEANYLVIFTRNRFLKLLLTIYKRYFYQPKPFVIRNPFR